jgi:hypothetical protein
MNSNTFITGQGVPPTIPAVSGVPHIVNLFPAANNAGSSGTVVTVAPTVAVTAAPTAAATLTPTTAATVAPTAAAGTGNITYVITAFGVSFQCSNGAWTDFGLTMNVFGYFNGVGPSQPMAETGLPTIKMAWFINGVAAPATLTSSFNVGNVASSGNVVSFSLLDDQPTIGGTFAVGTCTQGQTLPTITVSMTSNSVINGVGVTPNIPAVSGVPHIVNGFPAANNGGSVFNQDITTDTTASSPASSADQTPFVIAGVGMVAFGLVAFVAAVGMKRYKQRKTQDIPLLTTPKRESQASTSVYVAQQE